MEECKEVAVLLLLPQPGRDRFQKGELTAEGATDGPCSEHDAGQAVDELAALASPTVVANNKAAEGASFTGRSWRHPASHGFSPRSQRPPHSLLSRLALSFHQHDQHQQTQPAPTPPPRQQQQQQQVQPVQAGVPFTSDGSSRLAAYHINSTACGLLGCTGPEDYEALLLELTVSEPHLAAAVRDSCAAAAAMLAAASAEHPPPGGRRVLPASATQAVMVANHPRRPPVESFPNRQPYGTADLPGRVTLQPVLVSGLPPEEPDQVQPAAADVAGSVTVAAVLLRFAPAAATATATAAATAMATRGADCSAAAAATAAAAAAAIVSPGEALQRGQAVLAALPGIVTMLTCDGVTALFQNTASVAYMGLRYPTAPGLMDGLAAEVEQDAVQRPPMTTTPGRGPAAHSGGGDGGRGGDGGGGDGGGGGGENNNLVAGGNDAATTPVAAARMLHRNPDWELVPTLPSLSAATIARRANDRPRSVAQIASSIWGVDLSSGYAPVSSTGLVATHHDDAALVHTLEGFTQQPVGGGSGAVSRYEAGGGDGRGGGGGSGSVATGLRSGAWADSERGSTAPARRGGTSGHPAWGVGGILQQLFVLAPEGQFQELMNQLPLGQSWRGIIPVPSRLPVGAEHRNRSDPWVQDGSKNGGRACATPAASEVAMASKPPTGEIKPWPAEALGRDVLKANSGSPSHVLDNLRSASGGQPYCRTPAAGTPGLGLRTGADAKPSRRADTTAPAAVDAVADDTAALTPPTPPAVHTELVYGGAVPPCALANDNNNPKAASSSLASHGRPELSYMSYPSGVDRSATRGSESAVAAAEPPSAAAADRADDGPLTAAGSAAAAPSVLSEQQQQTPASKGTAASATSAASAAASRTAAVGVSSAAAAATDGTAAPASGVASAPSERCSGAAAAQDRLRGSLNTAAKSLQTSTWGVLEAMWCLEGRSIASAPSTAITHQPQPLPPQQHQHQPSSILTRTSSRLINRLRRSNSSIVPGPRPAAPPGDVALAMSKVAGRPVGRTTAMATAEAQAEAATEAEVAVAAATVEGQAAAPLSAAVGGEGTKVWGQGFGGGRKGAVTGASALCAGASGLARTKSESASIILSVSMVAPGASSPSETSRQQRRRAHEPPAAAAAAVSVAGSGGSNNASITTGIKELHFKEPHIKEPHIKEPHICSDRGVEEETNEEDKRDAAAARWVMGSEPQLPRLSGAPSGDAKAGMVVWEDEGPHEPQQRAQSAVQEQEQQQQQRQARVQQQARESQHAQHTQTAGPSPVSRNVLELMGFLPGNSQLDSGAPSRDAAAAAAAALPQQLPPRPEGHLPNVFVMPRLATAGSQDLSSGMAVVSEGMSSALPEPTLRAGLSAAVVPGGTRSDTLLLSVPYAPPYPKLLDRSTQPGQNPPPPPPQQQPQQRQQQDQRQRLPRSATGQEPLVPSLDASAAPSGVMEVLQPLLELSPLVAEPHPGTTDGARGAEGAGRRRRPDGAGTVASGTGQVVDSAHGGVSFGGILSDVASTAGRTPVSSVVGTTTGGGICSGGTGSSFAWASSRGGGGGGGGGSSRRNGRRGGGGGGGVVGGLSPAGSCWHEVTVTPMRDPVSGRPALLVLQLDASARVRAERVIADVLETEHRLLESIFPRHVLEVAAANRRDGIESTAGAGAGKSMASPRAGGGVGGVGVAMAGDVASVVCDIRSNTAGGGAAASGATLRRSHTADPHATATSPHGSDMPLPLASDCASLATYHSMVTVLFADIVGFTSMCHSVEPGIVMQFLNKLYSRLDSLLDLYGVYKVETIGDCYMVAGGLMTKDSEGFMAVRGPKARDDLHAAKVLAFAKAMLREVSHVTLPTTGKPVQMRIGLHSGPIMSGIVGTRMPRFCLFGDTVNTASRMESTCDPGCIHVSAATRACLTREVDEDAEGKWTPSGGVEVKGKGLMNTFLWRRRQDTDIIAGGGSVNDGGSTWPHMGHAAPVAYLGGGGVASLPAGNNPGNAVHRWWTGGSSGGGRHSACSRRCTDGGGVSAGVGGERSSGAAAAAVKGGSAATAIGGIKRARRRLSTCITPNGEGHSGTLSWLRAVLTRDRMSSHSGIVASNEEGRASQNLRANVY